MGRPPISSVDARDEELQSETHLNELDSIFLDFDPIKEWIVDSEQYFMSGDDAKELTFDVSGHEECGSVDFGVLREELGQVCEIMGSSVDMDAKDGISIGANECSVVDEPKSPDFLSFDQKKVELEGYCALDEPLIDEGTEMGLIGEILPTSDDERTENISLVENSSKNASSDPQSESLVLLGDNSGTDNGNDNHNDVVADSGIGTIEVQVGVSESRDVVEVHEVGEDYLVTDSIKVNTETDEESSGSESNEVGEEETSSEDSSSSSSSDSFSEEEKEVDNIDDNDNNGNMYDEGGYDLLNKSIRKQLHMDADGEMEEGEIKDAELEKMTIDSDEEAVKGPIRSKNEIEDLTPVPNVEVSLEPHHQTLPVGIILSILDNKVIVEGSEKHNPLNEGSILWIAESRTPLGFVDEIFGPVKNPYYIVRFNSEKEIPGEISVGSSVAFVQEFASYVLNQKDIYKKGYDASGDNDEELDDDEFSDDEKEALHKKSLREAKRGNSDRCQESSKRMIDKRNSQKFSGLRKVMSPLAGSLPESRQPQTSISSGLVSHVAGNFGNLRPENASSSINSTNPSFNITPQMNSSFGNLPQQQLNAFWLNGFPLQPQQQHPVIQGLMMNILASQQHQNQFNSFPNGMPFQQQNIPGLQPPANTPWPSGPLTPSVASVPMGSQPSANAPFFAGNYGQVSFGCSSNMQEQVSSATPPTMTTGPRPPTQFNHRSSNFRGGRRPHHRGARHSFSRGRGGRANNR